VIVTVTLNPALRVEYAAHRVCLGTANPVSQVSYRAGGAGLAVARVLHTFGHDVVAAGLAGGTAGQLIRAELARSGIATQFTPIAMESRRAVRIADASDGRVTTFDEPAPYITTEELGRLARDYRALMDGATAVVLCGSLPEGLPPEIYASLASYAAEAGVPAVLAADGSTLWPAVSRHPALAVPGCPAADPADLVARGARAAAAQSGGIVQVVTEAGTWRAWLPAGGQAGDTACPQHGGRPGSIARAPASGRPASASWPHDVLVAGFVPGIALGWSWADMLRHAVALAAAARPAGEVDLARYEALLPDVEVEPPAAR
jgi:tagatose 6-phosphate kinase